MSAKCKLCGGDFVKDKNGTYRCIYCGNILDDSDSMNTSQYVANANNSTGADIFNKNIESILEINSDISSGSGYVISNNGYIITNTHVVVDKKTLNPYRTIRGKIGSKVFDLEVICLGDDRAGDGNGIDLALLKIKSRFDNLKALQLGNSQNVNNGEQVFVIGNSLGQGICITSGIVSDKMHNVNGRKWLMTDCAINGGNSGGPIFNAKGEVIGTIVASQLNYDGTSTKGMNYAIPIDDVKTFINVVASRFKLNV